MLELFIVIMVSISMFNIIVNETIFSFLREFLYKKYPKFYSFIQCPVCFSWWIGLFISFFITIYGGFVINMFICAFISSISNSIYYDLMPEKFNSI